MNGKGDVELGNLNSYVCLVLFWVCTRLPVAIRYYSNVGANIILRGVIQVIRRLFVLGICDGLRVGLFYVHAMCAHTIRVCTANRVTIILVFILYRPFLDLRSFYLVITFCIALSDIHSITCLHNV